ncbi:MAG: hypothetical protein LLG04_15020 [Parachlamydia sp.]|nr:hypothetical protein [Parachlamydia sp.]
MQTTNAAPVGQQYQPSVRIVRHNAMPAPTALDRARYKISLVEANLKVIHGNLVDYQRNKVNFPDRNHSTFLKNIIAERQNELADLSTYLKQNDVKHGLPIGTENYAILANKMTTFEFQLNKLKKFKSEEDLKHFSYKPYAFAAVSCMLVALAALAVYSGALKV